MVKPELRLNYDVEALAENAKQNISFIENMVKEPEYNDLIGSYRSCWIGRSADSRIVSQAASGGLVSQLLIQALEQGLVNKVLILGSTGVSVSPVLTDDADMIKVCQGSIYNYGRVMDYRGIDNKCAIVALPCQASKLAHLENRPLIIGLFCGHTIMREGMEYLYRYLGVELGDIKVVRYRANINGRNGLLITAHKNIFIPLETYFSKFFNFFFIPDKCLKCQDQTAEYADISCGDAWLRDYKNMSICMVRTGRGEQLFNSAIESKTIDVDLTTGRNVVRSQKKSLYYKKGKNDVATKVYKVLRSIGRFISRRPKLYFVMHYYFRLIGIKRV